MYSRSCGCGGRLGSVVAFDFLDGGGTNDGTAGTPLDAGGGGGGGGFDTNTSGGGARELPPWLGLPHTGEPGGHPLPVWEAADLAPDPGTYSPPPSDPYSPTPEAELDTNGGGGGGGGYAPEPTRTDPAGGGRVPTTDPGTGDAPGPEVAAPGAGEELLGWILGSFLSAALISRER